MEMTSAKLKEIEKIEQELALAVHSAGATLQELSKEKPSMKQIETHSSQYVKSLEVVERELSEKIMYLTKVSTGHSHEGSAYASHKVLNMSQQRMEHAKLRVSELESSKSPKPEESAPEHRTLPP